MNKNKKEGNKPYNVNTRVVVLTILNFHNLSTKTNDKVLRRCKNNLPSNLFFLFQGGVDVQQSDTKVYYHFTKSTSKITLQMTFRGMIGSEQRKGNAILKKILLFFTLIVIGYLSGAYSFSHQIWPINVIIANRNAAIAEGLSRNFNEFGAFSNLAEKKEIPCPTQNSSTAVVLVLGQSNSANHAEKKFISQYPAKVLNYYFGKCYSAESPLLGASGLEGEYLTLLGDLLIEKGNLRNVILVNKSIGGTTVSDWGNQGKFSTDLVTTLNALILTYRVTDIIWHQGESDLTSNTSFREYRESFQKLKLILNRTNITAPIFIVVSTICGYNPTWTAQNPVATAQKSLIDKQDIFLGIDTDASLLANDRRPQSPSQEPNCHLSEQGQVKVAGLMSSEILKFHNF